MHLVWSIFGIEMYKKVIYTLLNPINRQTIYTIFDLISEHTLISGHPPHFVLVEIIVRARAHRDLCVLAVLLCCIMQSIFDAKKVFCVV